VRAQRADALYALSTAENYFNRNLLVELEAKSKLPAMFTAEPYASAGGLISYSPQSDALFADAAVFVHKILSGRSR
jgi:putative ABC transport system substrate-binding protein